MRLGTRRDIESTVPSTVGTDTLVPSAASGAGDVDRGHQVVAVADEPVVLADADEDVKIAGRAAALARVATARDPDPLAVRDARRDVDRDLRALDAPSPPVAGLARLAWHLALSPADVARGRSHHLTERSPRHGAQLAGPVAAGAGVDRRSGLGSVAIAVLAQDDRLVGDLHRVATGRLCQIDLGGDRDVAALDRATATAASKRAGAAEGAAEPAAAEERVEDVRERSERVEVRGVAAAAQPLVAEAVVGRPPLGIAQDLVRLGRLLELLLGLWIAAVDVGMELAGEAPEGLLDLILAGVA